jgi:hypothetical protein
VRVRDIVGGRNDYDRGVIEGQPGWQGRALPPPRARARHSAIVKRVFDDAHVKGSEYHGTTLSVPMNNKVLGQLWAVCVARMERSEIRGKPLNRDTEFLDYAALYPGYRPRLSRVRSLR